METVIKAGKFQSKLLRLNSNQAIETRERSYLRGYNEKEVPTRRKTCWVKERVITKRGFGLRINVNKQSHIIK